MLTESYSNFGLDGVALELNERGIHAYGLVRAVPQ